MIISIIAALARNNVIGYKNTLPWGRIPEDMNHFRELTLGKPVIMGKNTFLSLGKPLKDRVNIVLSSENEKEQDNVIFASSIKEALDSAREAEPTELMIIGGAFVYNQFMSIADKLYITFIDEEFEGDTFFPEIEKILDNSNDSLLSLNLKIINFFKTAFNINTKIILASSLDIPQSLYEELNASEILAEICKKLNAATYLAGPGSKDYMDLFPFQK